MTKQTKITDFYKKKTTITKIYGYNKITQSWHCTSCGKDMGPNNPRQLCEKIYCPWTIF